MDTALSTAIDAFFSALKIETTSACELEMFKQRSGDGLPVEIAELHGRMVSIALSKGNRDMAHQIIDRAFRVWEAESNMVSSRSTVESVFSTRQANRLLEHNLRTIDDVICHTLGELAKLISYQTALAVEKTLNKHGFDLSN